MKVSELLQLLAEYITENGDVELGENFMVTFEYGRLKIY